MVVDAESGAIVGISSLFCETRRFERKVSSNCVVVSFRFFFCGSRNSHTSEGVRTKHMPTHPFYYSLPKREKEEDKKRKRKKKIHDAARRHRLTTVASIVVMWGRPPSSPRRRGGGGEHRRPNARAAGPTTTTTTTTTTTVFGAATQKSRLPPRERGGPSPSP